MANHRGFTSKEYEKCLAETLLSFSSRVAGCLRGIN